MWVTQTLLESWTILRESAFFILVGFAIAGVLHVLMARGGWATWLKGLGAKSVLLASAVGLPLPLCSCSVLPAAISLRKQGASKGATLSFLISTPETSVSSVLLTYALLGPVMAIFRPLAACITALVAGITENFVERRSPSPPEAAPDDAPSCCGCNNEEAPPERIGWSAGMRHAFVEIFDDVMGWMILGVVVAALIQVLVPGFLIQAVFGPPLQAMLVMLVIGVPLYVCAEASTPIAAALILQGVSPGAALVFLLAGPATNLGAVGVLHRQLGRRTVVIYLVSIAIVSVLMGLGLDWFFGSRGVSLSTRALSEPFVPAWCKTAGAVLFLMLCLASLWRMRFLTRLAGWLDWLLPLRVTRGRLMGFAVLAIPVGYFGSGFYTIQPGEVGMEKRFGAVVRQDVAPGLHYAWPWPVGAVDRVETQRVYRLEFGTAAKSESAVEDETASWVLLGDENIANIACATHWRMKPGETTAFAYGAGDQERVVGSAVKAALRSVLGSAAIETVFTIDQAALADRVQAQAQAVLDSCACGVEIVAFAFLDLHAPPQVHDAFRDIASALEDKTTRRNRALAYQAKLEPLARGTQAQLVLSAQAYTLRTVAEATGQAASFDERRNAFRAFYEVTRTRMVYEMFDQVFPGLSKCIKPTNDNLYLDLRYEGEVQEKDIAF